MLSNHEDIAYVPLPYHRLDEVGIDESILEEVHEIDCIVGGCFRAHSCTPNLQVVFHMKGKVVASENKLQQFKKGSFWAVWLLVCICTVQSWLPQHLPC